MNYDLSKYHIITTNNNVDYKENIQKQFNSLFGNNTKINFCVKYNSSRFSNIYIKDEYDPNDTQSKITMLNTSWLGVMDALIQCLNIANLANWPYVFIIDDSVTINKNFNNEINKSLNNINDFLCVVLGYYGKPKNKYNEFLFNIDKTIIKLNSFLILQNHYLDIIKFLNQNKIYSKESWLYNFENCYCLKESLCTMMY